VIMTSVLTSGSAQCVTGCNKSESFIDMNGNGAYESTLDTFYTEFSQKLGLIHPSYQI